MAESTCALDAPPSAPSLAGAALTTGAAVVTGMMLGRKGLAGLAAGMAAMAGAKWLSNGRRQEERAMEKAILAEVVVDSFPEIQALPMERDWVDDDAVVFTHAVPDAAVAMEMLRE